MMTAWKKSLLPNKWTLRLVLVIAWICAVSSARHFLLVWLAPDACLDAGGSFDYVKWQCAGETHVYIDVWPHELAAFWIVVLCVSAAIAMHICVRRLDRMRS